MRGLSGKRVLITGGAGGIGTATAQRFLEEGARVAVIDRDQAACQRLAQALPALEVVATADVSQAASVAQAFEQIDRHFGGLDILINNAGISLRHAFMDITPEEWRTVLETNLNGVFYVAQQAARRMLAAGGGVILNMASICGLVGHKYTNEAYSATKGALTLLTKSVAVRYAKDNIRCNSVHPSTVETALVANFLKDPERRAERLGEVPLGRLATATDVANAFVYLASDEAAFLNGAAIPVDGGLTAA